MFTGIVECKGTLLNIERTGSGAKVRIKTPQYFVANNRVNLGDSIATNGVCLTATQLFIDGYSADLSFESFNLTTFQYLTVGSEVNLELACTPHTRLGGHIMQGHVDGIGTIVSTNRVDGAINVWVNAPNNLARYIAMKGSIAVDGISLTINEVVDNDFRLTLIPHTQDSIATQFKAGLKVNLEVDVLSRYLERLLLCGAQDKTNNKQQGGLSKEFLAQHGFF